MASRRLIANETVKAAKATVFEEYEHRRISSERSFQASIWTRLEQQLRPKKRNVFIEPVIRCEDGGRSNRRYPDLVICNTREVIGIVELKYLPRRKPIWKKDAETLSWIVQNRDSLVFEHKRFRVEPGEAKTFPISKSLLLAWVGIHAPWPGEIFGDVAIGEHDMFLEVHAEVSRKKTEMRVKFI